MALPPGPQNSFRKDRSYGEQPGFVSRHSGKIFITLAVLVIIGITLVVLGTLNDQPESDATPQQSASHNGHRISTLS